MLAAALRWYMVDSIGSGSDFSMFPGIGIYAWSRKKPMWFWSGTAVKEELSDAAAYNHANGVIWRYCIRLFSGCL